MLKEIQKFLQDINPRWMARKISQYPEYVVFLKQLYPSYSLNEHIQFVLKNLDKEPLCPVCNSKLNDIRKTTCSHSCSSAYQKAMGKDKEKKEKYKETMLERYGVENALMNGPMRDMAKESLYKKYGALVSPKARQSSKDRAAELVAKGKISLKEKYGVDNPSQIIGHAEKCKNTMLQHYGVDHASKIPEKVETRHLNKLRKLEQFVPKTIKICSINKAPIEKLLSFTNPNDVIQFSCACCNTNYTAPYETFKWRTNSLGTPCPSCGGISSGSRKETELGDFIESLGVKIVKNDRTLISPMEIDILIPDQKLAFEFNGLYWHNDLRIDKNYHKQKSLLCERVGYQLIHIFEDEWDQKKEIVKHRIRNMLNLSTKVAARKCQIKIIDTSTAKEFINEYHIQGYANSTHKLGIFTNDTLVGVMTFAKPSLAKGAKRSDKNIWELSRYCSSVNVVGGISKLLSHFIKNYDPDEIFSYSDNRWGSGNSYVKAGMTYASTTEPGYWYFDGITRIHRFALRKTKNDPSHITEYELRSQEGYYRIWDCGNKKFIWKKGP